MATHIWGNGMEYENPLVVTLDNQIIYQTVDGGEEDMKLYDQVQNGALDRVNARLKNIQFADDRRDRTRSASRSSADLRGVRRSAAGLLARRRTGSSVSREFLPAAGSIRCASGLSCDAKP